MIAVFVTDRARVGMSYRSKRRICRSQYSVSREVQKICIPVTTKWELGRRPHNGVVGRGDDESPAIAYTMHSLSGRRVLHHLPAVFCKEVRHDKPETRVEWRRPAGPIISGERFVPSPGVSPSPSGIFHGRAHHVGGFVPHQVV